MSRLYPPLGAGADGAACAGVHEPDASRVRSLAAWSDAQKSSLARRYLALWEGWSARWAQKTGEAVAPDVSVRMGHGPQELASWSLTPRAAKANVSQEPDGGSIGRRLLLEHLLGDGFGVSTDTAESVDADGSPIAREVAQAAWDDWLEALSHWVEEPISELAQPSAHSSDQGFDTNWSGALLISASFFDEVWHLHLPAAAVRRLLGADALRRPLQSAKATFDLAPALVHKTLEMRVSLEDVHLSLRQLQDLQVGDVVTLSHALDAPAHVHFGEGGRAAQGWLAQHAGHVAAVMADMPDPAASASRSSAARTPTVPSSPARTAPAARPTQEIHP